MIDIVREIEAIRRTTGDRETPAGNGKAVVLEREYDAPIDEVWDAVTSPERISRWFLPISGDYRVGGTYQLEGNAGGEIVACERPNRFKVTWVYGEPENPGDVSEVEVRLSSVEGDRTRLELEHVADVPNGSLGRVRARRRWRRVGRRRARARAAPPRRLDRGPERLAGLGRGPRLLHPQQCRLGGGKSRRGRNVGSGGARRREHDRVLRAGARDRLVGAIRTNDDGGADGAAVVVHA